MVKRRRVCGGVCTSEVYPTSASIALYRVLGSDDSEVTLGADVLGRTWVLFDVTYQEEQKGDVWKG